MKHTPVLIIDDEVDGPGLHILTRCRHCDITVSEREIDASKVPLGDAGEFGVAIGEEDVNAWLQHIAEGRA